MTTDNDDLTSIEKGALVGWYLATGKELTTSQVRDDFGISIQAAKYILESASRVLPVYSTPGMRPKDPHSWRRFNHT